MSRPVAGLVLAAGFSRRMQGRDKLLCEVDGVVLLRRAVLSMLDGGLAPVAVVLPPDGQMRRAALDGLDVQFVTVDDPERGMGRSLAGWMLGHKSLYAPPNRPSQPFTALQATIMD